jgi:DNA-binding NarL/FixJ family response regulator
MTAARELEAVVVDHCFTRLRLQARRALLDDLGASTVKLSKRETEVLSLIESGLTNNEIASRDGLSINTVESCIRRLSGKIGARNRVDAVRRAKLLGF